jgi:hypothetical protein
MGVLLRFLHRTDQVEAAAAVEQFDCPYCQAPPGVPCHTQGRRTVVPHQLRVDEAETLLGPHWLVTYPAGQAMSEQCACHLLYDHDEFGARMEQV